MAEYCSSLTCYQYAPCRCQEGTAGECDPKLAELSSCVRDESAPVAKRIQSVYLLRDIGGETAVKAMAPALGSKSVLLSHEVAYLLGQMQHPSALPFLEATLANSSLDPITRHEAAEALAALSMEIAEPILRRFLSDERVEVRDTCQIAVDRISWRRQNPELASTEKEASEFHSVDPAPGHAPEIKSKTAKELGDILCDSNRSLFDRYQAMFALRNKKTKEAVLQLCRGFHDTSAVFRHEVAYVLGQLQHPASVPALTERLIDSKEHEMVRHEAAEALGSIDEEESVPVLEQYQQDHNSIVAESCDVALSIAEYWKDFEKGQEGQVAEGN